MTLTPAAEKPWTFMVYMAGDNDLEADGVKDLQEMKKVGSTDKVNVIAQFDRATGHAAKRYCLRKGGKVDADAVPPDLGNVNTGDPARLFEFIAWSVKYFPAKRYALVLWNHGQGWDDTDIFADERYRFLRRYATRRIRHTMFKTSIPNALASINSEQMSRAILLDPNSKDFIDNIELKQVLVDTAKEVLHRKFDLLGMDACLMSMIEVGYQIRLAVNFTVGSEQTEPLAGWPYHLILAKLAQNPEMTPRDLSGVIVDQYLASYKDTDEQVTQSACDLSQAEALAAAIDSLAMALQGSLGNKATMTSIRDARDQAQSYDAADNIDLVDFCSLLAKYTDSSRITQNCQGVIQAVQSYVLKQGYKGNDLKNSHGVAIYFPIYAARPPYVSPLYAKNLDFAQTFGWGEFLQAYNERIRSRP